MQLIRRRRTTRHARLGTTVVCLAAVSIALAACSSDDDGTDADAAGENTIGCAHGAG